MATKNSHEYGADVLRDYAIISQPHSVHCRYQLSYPGRKRVVAHELEHIIRNDARMKAHPIRDFSVYSATDKLKHEAGLFAARFLLRDEKIWDEIHSCGADLFSVA